MPWEKVEQDYSFEGPNGKETLSQLFNGKNQLIVYHLMYSPEWDNPCSSCSYWIDQLGPTEVHLKARDTSIVVIGRAPYDKLAAGKKKLGWTVKVLSSKESDFNYDYNVSFKGTSKEDDIKYNYKETKNSFGVGDYPGLSVFAKGSDGQMYHTYSTFARGLDMLNGTYHLLDVTPKGRDEPKQGNPQFWVKRNDEYE